MTVMTFNCVSLIMATIVMNIKKRGDDNPPPVVPAWFFCLCHNVFGRVVCTRYLWKDQIPYPVEVNENDKNESSILNKSFVSQGAAVSSNHSNTTENSSAKPSSKLEKKNIYSPGQENQCSVHANSNKCRNEFSDEINTTIESAQSFNTTAEEHPESTGRAPLPDSLSQTLPSGNNCCSRQQTCFSRRGQDRRTGKTDNAHSQFDTCGSYQKDLVQSDNRELSSMNNPDSDISKNYLMKRRWFYVAEVVDKFLFIVYLMLLTFSIFTILFLIPVYFRKDK